MVAVQVLDRVLDGDDVRRPVLVDVVDHRRQRRALARAGRARHEHQAAFLFGDALEHVGQFQRLDRRHLGRDDADDQRDRAALREDVAAEAAEPGDAVGRVDLLVGDEVLALLDVEHRRRHRFGVIPLEAAAIVGDEQCAVHPHHGVAAHLDVDVGGATANGVREEVVEVHDRPSSPIGSGAMSHERARTSARHPARAVPRPGIIPEGTPDGIPAGRAPGAGIA